MILTIFNLYYNSCLQSLTLKKLARMQGNCYRREYRFSQLFFYIGGIPSLKGLHTSCRPASHARLNPRLPIGLDLFQTFELHHDGRSSRTLCFVICQSRQVLVNSSSLMWWGKAFDHISKKQWLRSWRKSRATRMTPRIEIATPSCFFFLSKIRNWQVKVTKNSVEQI
jgi:hypothetical protein